MPRGHAEVWKDGYNQGVDDGKRIGRDLATAEIVAWLLSQPKGSMRRRIGQDFAREIKAGALDTPEPSE